MPELPEVETTRLGVIPHVVGRTILNVTIRNPALRWPVQLPSSVAGSRVAAVERRGKYLLFDLGGEHLIVHLGMSGSLRIVPEPTPPRTHDHVDLALSSGQILRFNDPRRFGSWHWQGGNVLEHWLLRDLGVEPFDPLFDGDYLKARGAGRKQAVKNFIMDGKVVVGVGNIYATEALFLAGVRPTVRANRVSREAYARIAQSIVKVLGEAIEMGGTTLRDFVGTNGEPGYFKQKLYAYGRAGEPCRRCAALLKQVIVGQRSSVYCPKCQRAQGFARD